MAQQLEYSLDHVATIQIDELPTHGVTVGLFHCCRFQESHAIVMTPELSNARLPLIQDSFSHTDTRPDLSNVRLSLIQAELFVAVYEKLAK
jgi:hypothetical protein